MTEPYSLAVEPWLPVAMKDGERISSPIRDIGRADVLRIDTGRADCDISLTEFLIGLLAVSMGPSGLRDWVRRYETPPSPDEIDAAIKPFAHALLLDGTGRASFRISSRWKAARKADFLAPDGDAGRKREGKRLL